MGLVSSLRPRSTLSPFSRRRDRDRRGAGLVVRAAVIALVHLCVVRADVAHAQERLVRRFAADHGLEVPPVHALAQDRDGALWIATSGGLYRFDGVEFRRWAPDRITGSVAQIAVAADGRIAVQSESGPVIELRSGGAVALPSPPEGWPPYARSLAYDDRGRLWSVVGDGGALARFDRGGWRVVDRAAFGGEAVRRVFAAATGGLLVLTDAGLWHLDLEDAAPRRRFDGFVVDVESDSAGRLYVLTGDNRMIVVEDGRARVLASEADGQLPSSRPIALVERKGTIWVALDRYLVAIREGRAPQTIGSIDGLDSGGPLLVDHEGSLWLGGFSALFQFPEPETTVWYERGGLPGRHTRYVARSEDVIWVTTWQGTGRIRRTTGGLSASTVADLASHTRPCADSLGTVWLATGNGIVRVRGERVIGRFPIRTEFHACAAAPGPALWIGTNNGLLHVDARAGSLHPVQGLPTGDAPVQAVLEDRAGRIWITNGARICHAPAVEVRATAGESAGWACEPLPPVGEASALIELDGGELWLATRRAGILARGADGWSPLPANAGLATRDIFALVPSPSGGVWVAGQGVLQRVSPGGPEGWEVLEAPSPGNGLHAGRGADLLEDDDGTLWIATSVGLVQVPPEARRISLDPPRVLLMDARVDAEPVPLTDGLELPADRNRLELRFAALSYRDPGRVRYQVRLSPTAPWVGTLGLPSFRWVDLPPGTYRAEVRASLDGRRWSAEPARFEFRVLPPWYRTPWALAIFAAAAVAALWGVYRARMAYLIGLERQRTQIAMDLHDELGSGLGSIGILAGILPVGRVGEAHRSRIAGEIAAIAAELGSALADIIWSLDPRSATLEELAARLAEHGDRLFPSDDVEFRMRAPREWPAAELPLPLRRNVLLIGLEALHNAARHSRAREVTLTWSQRGRVWKLVVSDDGIGLDPDAPDVAGQGRGLEGMRRRAAEIGASIKWLPNPGGGTRVVLRFTIPGRSGGLTRLRRRRRG